MHAHPLSLTRAHSRSFDDFLAPLEDDSGRIRCVAAGLAAAARRAGLERIAVATGRLGPVFPWLRPDWLYCTDTRTAWARRPAASGGDLYECTSRRPEDALRLSPPAPHEVRWSGAAAQMTYIYI